MPSGTPAWLGRTSRRLTATTGKPTEAADASTDRPHNSQLRQLRPPRLRADPGVIGAPAPGGGQLGPPRIPPVARAGHPAVPGPGPRGNDDGTGLAAVAGTHAAGRRGLSAAAGTMAGMAISDPKTELHAYLDEARSALVWKLDGLSEYDIRRPLTPTGTNLLGLIKHLAAMELGYFGDTFGRPVDDQPQWSTTEGMFGELNVELWATADESREYITGWYQRACAHSDATIEQLDLDSAGQVAWWRPGRQDVTLHRILVHMIAETHRHAGHADIVRELIDGAAGLRADNSNLPDGDAEWWAAYRDRVEQAARRAGGR
jgi:uncharacterized damage-inducible protein DinB